MSTYLNIQNLRNIGIVAHIDAGKTTTTERILYYTGKIWRMGEVHDGTATMDFLEEERKRGITIQSAVTTCYWEYSGQKYQINIIDTPGHVDFTAEVERSLRVLDGAVVVFCGVGGVEPQSETVWRQATKYNVPIIAFINKLDRVGSDFWRVVSEMRECFTQKIIPITIPTGKEKDFNGLIDIIDGKARIWEETGDGTIWHETEIPSEYMEIYQKQREELLEALSEVDDRILEAVVENKPLLPEEIKSALRKAVIKKSFVPVVCGSALKNKGIQFLIDCICLYLPSPEDIENIPLYDIQTGEKVKFDRSSFWALVFKVVSDRFFGRFSYIRVYSGKCHKGKKIYNTVRKKAERIEKIFSVHADKREAIGEMQQGDIVGVVGLKFSKTGDTLSSERASYAFEPPSFPEPVICQAVEPESPSQFDSLSMALSKLSEEDPTFIVKRDTQTDETIVYGMGELHLEVNLNRLKKEFKVPVRVSKPRVRYKEGITKEVIHEEKYVKQTGGHGQYAHIVIRVSPDPEKKFEFKSSIKGGVIPSQFIPSIEEGVKTALESGPLAGYPVSNVKVELLDGSFHEVDSSDLAFKICAIEGMRKALARARPILLEPIMRVEIEVPSGFVGDVLGDLSARRGSPEGLTTKDKLTIINAYVPLAELFGYATDLRSITQGKASYVMEPAKFEPVPENIAEKIIGIGGGYGKGEI